MTKYVISGYIGFDNFGDEAIAKVLTSYLKSKKAKKITVLSSNPHKTARLYDVYSANYLKFFKPIIESDVLISGGGSLLQDITSLKSLIYYLAVIVFALVFKKKVIIFAAATVFSHFFANIIMGIANRIRNLCAEWFDEYFQVVVNERIMQLDFEQTEDPEVLNQMNKAKEGMSWYSGNVCGILNQFFDIINFVAVLISVVVILFVTVPMVIPIQIVCIALLIFFSKKICCFKKVI